MKKILSIFLILTLILSISTTLFADEVTVIDDSFEMPSFVEDDGTMQVSPEISIETNPNIETPSVQENNGNQNVSTPQEQITVSSPTVSNDVSTSTTSEKAKPNKQDNVSSADTTETISVITPEKSSGNTALVITSIILIVIGIALIALAIWIIIKI